MAIEINGTSGISGVDGSATTPALQGTDTNTGITFGTDIVNVVTGGSTRATVDSSGNVGIGTSSPQVPLQIGGASGTQDIVLHGGNNTNARLRFREGGTVSSGFNEYSFGMAGAANAMTWETAGSERMRISQNGSFCIMSTDATMNTFGTIFTPASNTSTQPAVLNFSKTHSGAIDAVVFRYNGSRKGSIRFDDTSTAYNTSSDYRLKENVVNLDGAIDRVKQLAPKRFNFIVDPDKTVDGFIAHEAQTVVPEAVTGVKDEVEVWQENETLPDGVSVGDNKLDEDGNTIPLPQGIDQSKLVPLLTAALQEAISKIEALETRVAQLEGGAA